MTRERTEHLTRQSEAAAAGSSSPPAARGFRVTLHTRESPTINLVRKPTMAL